MSDICIDWEMIWEQMVNRFELGVGSIHGPEHWKRVERYGLHVARQCGADLLVVRLFAVCHDVCRLSDGSDREHGPRAADLIVSLRGQSFELPDDGFEKLQYACRWHTAGLTSDDSTIGACWDADRLDLWRAGLIIHESYISTAPARELVRAGQIGPRHVPE